MRRLRLTYARPAIDMSKIRNNTSVMQVNSESERLRAATVADSAFDSQPYEPQPQHASEDEH